MLDMSQMVMIMCYLLKALSDQKSGNTYNECVSVITRNCAECLTAANYENAEFLRHNWLL